MKEEITLSGAVKLTLRNINTGEEEEETLHNLVMLPVRTKLLNIINGTHSAADLTDLKIRGVAVGTGTETALETDIKLKTENTRKDLNASEVDGDVAIFTAFFGATEAVITITELGLFSGAGWLIGTPNSGTLFSHLTGVSKTKTNQQTLSVEWSIRLKGA